MGYATAQDFQKVNRKDITLPSGLVVQIRKIKGMELVARFGFLPDAENTIAQKVQADPLKAAQFTTELICLAVVMPKVVKEHPQADEMTVEDFANDIEALTAEVVSYSLGAGQVTLSKFPEGLPSADSQPGQNVPPAA